MERQGLFQNIRESENFFVFPPALRKIRGALGGRLGRVFHIYGSGYVGYPRKNPGNYVLQGNLDPMLLSVATPAEVERETLKILSAQKCFGRHIFNLGHGILPDAKIENVEAMRKCVAEFK